MLQPTPRTIIDVPLLVAVVLLVAALFGGACGSSDRGSSATSTSAAVSTTAEEDVSTTTSAPAKTVEAVELCGDAELDETGLIAEDELSEISGVVASRDQPEVLWVHNDSGHSSEVWAIDHDGELLGRFSVAGARSVDWEDIGLGDGPSDDRDHLYVGDIGDNSFTPVLGAGLDPRTEANPVVVYRVLEPEVDVAPVNGSAAAVDTDPAIAFSVAYEDGPRDAEALLVDPVSGDVFVISKEWGGSAPGLYLLPAATVAGDDAPDGITTMERVADVAGPDGEPGPGLITGADISADGSLVAVRSYGSVVLWDRDPEDTLAETLVEPPTCTRKVDEPQGEAVAFGPDGQSLVTISEGKRAPLNWLSMSTD